MTTRTNPVTPWLSPSSDTGVVGDRITSLQNVQIGFSNWINSSSAFAWLDGDGNTSFNSNTDTLIIGGFLNVSLDPGPNFFTFYQVNKEDITSEPSYLAILYSQSTTRSVTAALNSSSDTGTLGDNVTAKKNVQIDLGNLVASGIAWLDRDGNTTFDSGVDTQVINGAVYVALGEENGGVNTFRFYQQDGGDLTSAATNLVVRYEQATTAGITAQLDSASDTGTLGDNITALQNVTINIGNLIGSGTAWLDRDGNTTFDLGVDTLIVGDELNVVLSEDNGGTNRFRFYQQNGEDLTSQATTLDIRYDVAAAAQQAQENEDNLAQAALAYLGRPLTSTEHDMLLPLLENATNSTDALIEQLSRKLEFFAIYSEPTLGANIDRCYNILFGRDASAEEITYWSDLTASGTAATDLPWLIAEAASGSDQTTLVARILFAQQATADFDANLAEAGVSQRTLLEVERELLQSIDSLSDIPSVYESIITIATGIESGAASLSGLEAILNADYDDGIVGDFTTSLGSVKIDVDGIAPGAVAWMDNNLNGNFDPGQDTPIINGSVSANLAYGPNNTLVFYQMLGETVSSATYLSLLRSNTSSDPVSPTAPTLDLITADDTGISSIDNVTTKNLVHIDIGGLDPESEMAWLETDGNGQFDLQADVALATGASAATALVQLGAGVNGLAAYQTRDGLTSAAGILSVIMVESLAGPTATLNAAYDDGTAGDSITSLASVVIDVGNIAADATAWLDSNLNGKFDPGQDSAVINGSVGANLAYGSNTLVFYQMLGETVSSATYLSLLRSSGSSTPVAPAALSLDLITADDNGTSTVDNVTTKDMVHIDVGNLDPDSELAWLETDGDGQFDLLTDILLSTGTPTASALIQLQDGINGISAYQTRDGLTSLAGNLTITRIQELAGPTASLNPEDDTDTSGDFITSKSSVRIDVGSIASGAIAWLDNDGNGSFDPANDMPIINNTVSVNLEIGANTLVFYQMLGDTVSSATYLSLLRYDSESIPVTPPAASLDLITIDDDGVDTSDNVTSRNLVRLDVSGLDPTSEQAWIETDGNGKFDLGSDIVLMTGSETTNALVPLESGINSFSVYQTRDGLTSAPGSLTILRIEDTDVVRPGQSWAILGNTISLEFDQPVDWLRLDTNMDGMLSISRPGYGGEFQIDWGVGGKDFDFAFTTYLGTTPDAGTWNVDVPTYIGRFITITDTPFDPTTRDLIEGDDIAILVVGVPDVATDVTSNVLFEGIKI